MLLRLVFALQDKQQELQLEQSFSRSDVHVECYGQVADSLQKFANTVAEALEKSHKRH